MPGLTAGTPSTPGAGGAHSRQPRLPSQPRGSGGAAGAGGPSKPKPPPHPRPSSLPDYGRASEYAAAGRPSDSSAVSNFRAFPARPPPPPTGVQALGKTLQQVAPGSLLARLGRTLESGFKNKKQREVDAARERARRGQAGDNVSDLLNLDDDDDEREREGDEADDEDSLAARRGLTGGGARTPGAHARASLGGTDRFGLDRLRRLLSPQPPRSGGSAMSDPDTAQRRVF